MHEFELIARYLAPLAQTESGARNLLDDAAFLDLPADHTLVATTDAIVAGIHFIGDEDPALIARKLLRVNLSDLAAKAAKPFAYLLTLMLPHETGPEWVARFAMGLGEDQTRYGITLAGGDTVATRGPASFSITALGLVPKGQVIERSGARSGDHIYVTGTLGDAALGLTLAKGVALSDLTDGQRNFLLNRYTLPEPRLAISRHLWGVATACIDVSDGLVQDLGHICRASGCGAELQGPTLPISPGVRTLLRTDPKILDLVLGGGDDYELLFTAHPAQHQNVLDTAARSKTPITHIGKVVKGDRVKVLTPEGQEYPLITKGYQHF